MSLAFDRLRLGRVVPKVRAITFAREATYASALVLSMGRIAVASNWAGTGPMASATALASVIVSIAGLAASMSAHMRRTAVADLTPNQTIDSSSLLYICMPLVTTSATEVSLMATPFSHTLSMIGVAIGAGATAGAIVALSSRHFVHLCETAITKIEHDIRSLSPEVVFYHSGAPDSTYQFRMWTPVLTASNRNVLVIFRDLFVPENLELSGLRGIHVPMFSHLFRVIPDTAKVFLYAGSGVYNMQMLRLPRPAHHVFIGHGDSDKSGSASFAFGAYSRIFVAGKMAIERFERSWFRIARDRFIVVGRPQLDVLAASSPPADGLKRVLYAPTWEGWTPTEDYCSLDVMGLAVVRAILASDPNAYVVFKPHPFTGSRRKIMHDASNRIMEFIHASGRGEVVEGKANISPHLIAAAALVTDVSSVANDFLATGRPLLMCNPSGLSLDAFEASFPTAQGAYVLTPGSSDLGECVRTALGSDPKAAARANIAADTLGTFRGNAQAVFDQAVTDLCADVDRMMTTGTES